MSTTEVNTSTPDRSEFNPLAAEQLATVIVVYPDSTSNNFNPKNSKGTASGSVTLYSGDGNYTPQVYTYDSSGRLIQAFTSGRPPYTATIDGVTYTLCAVGTITISLGSSTNPKNGTINVGSTK